MKLIIAYLRHEQLPAVKTALAEADIKHFSVMTIMGTAPKSEQAMYRGIERQISLFHRLRLEVAVKSDRQEAAITAISSGAKASGGYGKILVIGLDEIVTVWTGDRGEAEL